MVAVGALVIALPLIAIWVGNTLFHAEIPYTFKTWLAVACGLMVLRITVTWNRKVQTKTEGRFPEDLLDDDEYDDDDDDDEDFDGYLHPDGEVRLWSRDSQKHPKGPRK